MAQTIAIQGWRGSKMISGTFSYMSLTDPIAINWNICASYVCSCYMYGLAPLMHLSNALLTLGPRLTVATGFRSYAARLDAGFRKDANELLYDCIRMFCRCVHVLH